MCAWFLNQVQLFWGNFKQNSLKLMIEAILVADDFFVDTMSSTVATTNAGSAHPN